jgi:MULE transposase domain
MAIFSSRLGNMQMHKDRMSPSSIYRALEEECRSQDIDVTFLKRDIRNAYPPENTSLDCSNRIEHLQQWKHDDDALDFCFFTEPDGTLECKFFVLKDGKKILWHQERDTVILFDTKHGLNRYDHKLGCFCTIDANGKTHIIAVVFLLTEDEKGFTCAFNAFEDAFGMAPKVIFTDQDQAMDRAISA